MTASPQRASALARPAIEGGTPVRSTPLPYGRHTVTDDDVAAVTEVLRGDWLTTGPNVDLFERAVARVTGAAHVVAVSSGTAALHAACATLGLVPGDEVIVPSFTFAASANSVVYAGGRPVFADIAADTMTLDPADVRARLTDRTRAVMLVHYAGLPVDAAAFRKALGHDVLVIEDAAHALGARTAAGPLGAASELAAFSFHPVKHATTAEGGAVATRSPERAEAIRRFRNHGLSADARERERANAWTYDLVTLGFNYRLSDVGAALGVSQLGRLPEVLARRRALARRYLDALRHVPEVVPQRVEAPDSHAWHIFPIAVRSGVLRVDRDAIVRALRAEGIAATVHYPPTHLFTYYRERFGTRPGMLPVTEDVAARVLTLPLFPAMTDRDQDDVVEALRRIVDWYRS